MRRLTIVRLRRRFSLVLAFLFATLTLLASLPHEHETADYSTPPGKAVHVLTAATAPCPLCHWLTVSYVQPPPVRTAVVITVVPIVTEFALPALVLHRLSVLNPSLRAPPSHSC